MCMLTALNNIQAEVYRSQTFLEARRTMYMRTAEQHSGKFIAPKQCWRTVTQYNPHSGKCTAPKTFWRTVIQSTSAQLNNIQAEVYRSPTFLEDRHTMYMRTAEQHSGKCIAPKQFWRTVTHQHSGKCIAPKHIWRTVSQYNQHSGKFIAPKHS